MSIMDIRPDRRMAIEAMQNMGWTAKRTKPGKTVIWEFRRPDDDGLIDVVKCRQDQLGMHFVADKALQYGDANDLFKEIMEAKERWLKQRFFGIYKRAAEAET